MVLYGIMSGTSIGALFMAGIPTGILMAGFMMLVVYIISKKRNYPKSRRATPVSYTHLKDSQAEGGLQTGRCQGRF